MSLKYTKSTAILLLSTDNLEACQQSVHYAPPTFIIVVGITCLKTVKSMHDFENN